MFSLGVCELLKLAQGGIVCQRNACWDTTHPQDLSDPPGADIPPEQTNAPPRSRHPPGADPFGAEHAGSNTVNARAVRSSYWNGNLVSFDANVVHHEVEASIIQVMLKCCHILKFSLNSWHLWSITWHFCITAQILNKYGHIVSNQMLTFNDNIIFTRFVNGLLTLKLNARSGNECPNCDSHTLMPIITTSGVLVASIVTKYWLS